MHNRNRQRHDEQNENRRALFDHYFVFYSFMTVSGLLLSLVLPPSPATVFSFGIGLTGFAGVVMSCHERLLNMRIPRGHPILNLHEREPPLPAQEPEDNTELNQEHEKTLQERLEGVGYSSQWIINDKLFGCFINPVTRELVNDPVVTNTGEVVDRQTANQLIKNRLSLFGSVPIKDYLKVPVIRRLLVEEVERLEQAAEKAKHEAEKETQELRYG